MRVRPARRAANPTRREFLASWWAQKYNRPLREAEAYDEGTLADEFYLDRWERARALSQALQRPRQPPEQRAALRGELAQITAFLNGSTRATGSPAASGNAQAPNRPVARQPLFSPEERERLLGAYKRVPDPDPRGKR